MISRNANVLHSYLHGDRAIKYSNFVESGVNITEKQKFLADGDMTAITIRIPRNLRDVGKEAAALREISFSAYILMCMLYELTRGI